MIENLSVTSLRFKWIRSSDQHSEGTVYRIQVVSLGAVLYYVRFARAPLNHPSAWAAYP